MTQDSGVACSLSSQRAEERPAVWGLTAPRLHEAYWRAKGVQCLRCGEPQNLSRAAELFLLIEPRQFVFFDLAKLTDRLLWRNARVTRVRIVEQVEGDYSERVVTDERGFVARIERRYRPRSRASTRVMLTTNRRIGKTWMGAPAPREGWQRVRRFVPWSDVDSIRCSGLCGTEGEIGQERALISQLVRAWPDPGQAIDGIKEVAEGVWALGGEPVSEDAILIRPLWLGSGGGQQSNDCLVGPVWTEDQAMPEEEGRRRVRVREINDIAPTEKPNVPQNEAPVDLGYAVAKRTFDIVFSVIALVVSLPLFVIVALCIVLEDGRPIFYGHLRQRRGGRPFRCWKFRTMVRHADKLSPELVGENICDGPQVFIKHDARITGVGRLLRRLQIDEFPQFWNVFLGHMSIVGPRPSPDEENQYCPAWRDLRLSVRPGITGLWQIRRTRAPGEDFQEWIRYDIEYVRRANFWFDLAVCIRTAWVLLLGRRT